MIGNGYLVTQSSEQLQTGYIWARVGRRPNRIVGRVAVLFSPTRVPSLAAQMREVRGHHKNS